MNRVLNRFEVVYPNLYLALWQLCLCVGCSNPLPAPTIPESQLESVRRRTSHSPAESAVAQPADRLSNRPSNPVHGVQFRELAAEVGIRFQYETGADSRSLILESMGGGAGWLDYDRDGFQDLYFVQGGNPTRPPDSSQPGDLFLRNGDGEHFRDVTSAAGLGDRGYGQGVSIGDYDNDGFDDIYVTNFGHNVLYRNQGDGTFRNVTDSAGVDDPRWSTSAAWADLDRDGNLDLYVCNYLKWHVGHPQVCLKPNGQPGTCHPSYFEGEPDECFINLGDGSFSPQATARGLTGADSKSLGVAVADFDNDGHPDIYIAIDTRPNFLFINDGAGQFRESAVRLGCAVSAQGDPQASMGIAVGDFDRNGSLDLYLTHFTGEYNTLYQNLGPQGMIDVTSKMGLATPTLPLLGFGTIMDDFDQDGWPELFVANGHISDLRDVGIRWEMPPQVFTYRDAERRWFDISAETGTDNQRKILGRGVASGDYDNDGDFDLAVVAQNRPAWLLRNDSQRGHWLKLTCVGRQSNRSGIGTRVTLTAGSLQLMKELSGGTSYCSSNEHSLIFGVGLHDTPCEVEIRWPNGSTQTLNRVNLNQSLILIEP